MRKANENIKPLLIAGLITAFMIIVIANLSYNFQQKSVLDFDTRNVNCIVSICALL